MGGFAKRLGCATTFEAELWEVWGGLKLARARGFLKVELRLDSYLWFKIFRVLSRVTLQEIVYLIVLVNSSV